MRRHYDFRFRVRLLPPQFDDRGVKVQMIFTNKRVESIMPALARIVGLMRFREGDVMLIPNLQRVARISAVCAYVRLLEVCNLELD